VERWLAVACEPVGLISMAIRICRGELQNLANWRAEFGEICRQKLLFLFICIHYTSLFIEYSTENACIQLKRKISK